MCSFALTRQRGGDAARQGSAFQPQRSSEERAAQREASRCSVTSRREYATSTRIERSRRKPCSWLGQPPLFIVDFSFLEKKEKRRVCFLSSPLCLMSWQVFFLS